MIKWIVVVALFFSVAACSNGRQTKPDQGTDIIFPSGSSVQPDTFIQEAARKQLTQGEGGYFLLQFGLSLDDETRINLEDVNVILYDYVPNNAYYAFLSPESLSTLDELLESETLTYVGPIPNEAKLEAGLGEKIQENSAQSYDVTVQFFEELPLAAQEELNALMEVTGYSFGVVNLAEGVVAGTDVEKILSLPYVKWVEEKPLMELGD